MESNHPKTIEELLALPEELDERLETQTRGYLYHGTPNPNITVLEPREAVHSGRNDGAPAVCAGKNLQYSIFISLFNRSRHIYLLDPEDFDWIILEDPTHKSRRELRSLKAVKPVARIEVNPSDFKHEVKEVRIEDL